jgi:hypothetical protein
MGAWGTKPFEDDETLDWLDDLMEQRKPGEFLKECLDLEGIDYLEHQQCAGVLGTAVILDALVNGAREDLPDAAREWVEENRKLAVKPLVPMAIAGLDRLLADDSELHELWRENDKLYPEWKSRITRVRDRLQGSLE